MDGTVILMLSSVALNKAGVFQSSKFIVSASIKYAAEAALAYVISQWPVDTAKSIAGFRLERDQDSWNLVNNIPYAAYVHDGLFARIAPRALELANQAFDTKFKQLNDRSSGRSSAPAYVAPVQTPTRTANVATPRVDPYTALKVALQVSIGKRRAVAAAVRLFNDGRISSRAFNLIAAHQVKQAISILRAERKYEEVRIINSALKQ